MKKLIAIIMVMAMVLSNAFLIFADSAVSSGEIDLKKAIEIARNSFNLDTEGYDFNQNYNESQDGTKQWSLHWNSEEESISVSVDADTGEITSMNRWKVNYQSPQKLAKYKREDAFSIAEELLKNLQPEKYKEMKLIEPSKMGIYHDYDRFYFQYTRYIDGIPFTGNGVDIRIDKDTLEIQSYNLNWYKGEIPDSKKRMTIEKGKEAFDKNSSLELSYFIKYDNKTKSDKAILVYSLRNGNTPIDAITGKPLKNYYAIADAGGMGGGANAKEAASITLTPEEIKKTEEIAKYISKDKALEISKDFIRHNKKLELTYASLYTYDNNKAEWNLSWDYNDPKEKEYAYVSLSIDAISGELKSFHRSDSNLDKLSEGEPQYSKKECKKLADEFIVSLNPDKFKETEYRDDYEANYNIENPISYQFTYIRKVGDIACKGNDLRVTVNCHSGDITGFYGTWSDLEFPKDKNILSLEEAYKKLYKNTDFEPKYVIYYDYEKPYPKNISAKLIYSFTGFSGLMDPKTGGILDNNGEKIKDKTQTTFDDIEDHWAKEDIMALVEAGIIALDNKNFLPDTRIKQKDFIKLLINAISTDYYPIIPLRSDGESTDEEYDKYYKEAIRKNIISEGEKNINGSVSRIESAKMIVKALGLESLAKKTEIFNVFYDDKNLIDDELKGYVAIITGLDIMAGNKGYFRPDKALTKGEVASIIVHLLQH